MFEKEQNFIADQITQYLKDNNLPENEIRWAWIPFNGQWGISTSFFQLAAKSFGAEKGNVGQRANEIAQGVASKIEIPEGFSKVEVVNGYLNLYFSAADYSRRVIDEVLSAGAQYGKGEPFGKKIMFEFSQPNTHKAFHVGHLRSAFLGDVLSRISEAAGYEVVRANYPGDMGLHVIKWLWNYLKYHKGEKPEKDITRWMGAMYAEACKRIEENPDLEAEVRAIYTRWDQKDPEIVDCWKETREWSLIGFKEMYEKLDIKFDRYYFNSMFEEPGKEIVADLIARGIAEDERPKGGAVIVKLDEKLGLTEEKYRVIVVQRSDSTALYATEDLALARQKFLDYPDLEKAYYVVDVRQSLHFTQVFKTLEIAGYDWATRCQHVSYELVNLPGNVVMASREGTVVLLEDLLREATARALEVVKEKNPDLSEESKLKVAEAVGLGAVKYPMVSRDSGKMVTFDWETALDFNGQAAPYIQYAYVRANSILKKYNAPLPDSILSGDQLSASEIALIDLIARMPGEIQKAARELKPLTISNLAYELAKAFNDFYVQCPVLIAEEPIKSARIRLVAAAKQAIANSLALLGITAPQAM
ncbi:MAG: arginine--tRNA ligase [Chloroflexi bacterium HGW-Chloroflexi-4]|jgi:arginyl-tRNA synthetase|nr:MAG: arginine--tRNA ligase [Chloroflexi bacterium HGW-Chloroflexi-4]